MPVEYPLQVYPQFLFFGCRFGACSRTCGGGVRKSTRECNNPEPSETGDLCRGKNYRHESCNTQECPEGTPDFRTKQCIDFKIETVPFPSYNLMGKYTQNIIIAPPSFNQRRIKILWTSGIITC